MSDSELLDHQLVGLNIPVMEAAAIVNLTPEDLEDDIDIVSTHFDMSPPLTDDERDSLCTSQYAMVVFRDILDSYPTDSDVRCKYELNSDLEVDEGDFVALYQCGWSQVSESILRHPALSPDNLSKRGGTVIFPADALPKDEQEYYQLCYVSADGSVCGASVPFSFRRPHEGELCTQDMSDSDMGMVVVRSRTAVAEEKLRRVDELNEMVHREKEQLEAELEKTKQKLTSAHEMIEKMESLSKADSAEIKELMKFKESAKQRDRHMLKLQAEIKQLNESRNHVCNELQMCKQNSNTLNATIDTLNTDKTRMAEMMRNYVQRSDYLQKELMEKMKIVPNLEQQILNLTRESESAKNENEHLTEKLRLQSQCASEREALLVEEIASLRNDLLKSERVKQDVELLREHRSNLEQQLQLTDERFRSLREEHSNLKKRETDLVNQVLKLSQTLTEREPAMQTSQICYRCVNAETKVNKLEDQVTDLRLRLDQGAEEYKKIFIEKCKIEKRLLRSAVVKTGDSRGSSSKESSLSQDKNSGGGCSTRVCPMCDLTFPAGASVLFTQHFESHLS
ncbi:tax1-binding protein 1 homolog B-like [Cloeon dipterum]|uniref:tax1-binding protein 1 homolog B-like n=1 Tax=Cloeon dipterum TaxID=197152 RepID=UPI0032202ADD